MRKPGEINSLFAHLYCINMGSIISVELKLSEVRAVSDEFRFETFVDAHSNIFREYLSSVIAKLPESNEDYRAIQEQMETIFQQYPKVLEAVDTETATELSQQECAALIKVMELIFAK